MNEKCALDQVGAPKHTHTHTHTHTQIKDNNKTEAKKPPMYIDIEMDNENRATQYPIGKKKESCWDKDNVAVIYCP